MAATPQRAPVPGDAPEVRPYRRGDEQGIVELFARSFGRPIRKAHWTWKLATLPSPTENVWLAARRSAVVCHYGGIPCRFRIPVGERIAMVSVDAMTDPRSRRRGLLTAVATRAHERWQAAGIPFTLGLPNEQWGSRTEALGWTRLFSMEWLVRPVRPSALIGRRGAHGRLRTAIDSSWSALWNGGARIDSTVEIRQVAGEPDQATVRMLDGAWRTRREELDFSIVRDAAWLRWRYLTSPAIDYRLLLAARGGQGVGYVAYRIRATAKRKLIVVADLDSADDDEGVRTTLLARVIDDARDLGADAALALAVPGSALHRSLRRAGFVIRRGEFGVHMSTFDAKTVGETTRDRRRWRLAGGDFDVV